MGTFTNLALLAFYGLSTSSTPPPFQQGGEQGIYTSASLQTIERGLSSYLNAEMQKSILTPGDNVEWKVSLKAGQVIVGDASSDSCDTAAQIVDSLGKTHFVNDDRYPGDQRPLVFWRCDADGEYRFQVFSPQNKSGGQVFARYQVYDTIDLSSDKMSEGVFASTRPFLMRMQMKAGEMREIIAEKRGEGNYINFSFGAVISPNGLPERLPSFSTPIYPAVLAAMAPLPGDYYMVAIPYGYRGGDGRVRIGTRDIIPEKLVRQGGKATGKAPTNRPAVWELDVKAGELLEVTLPELNLDTKLSIGEASDISQCSTAKAETNPFYPVLRSQPPGPGPAFDVLPGRARDNRVFVLRASRDAKLWIGSDGRGPSDKQFSVNIQPAAIDFAEQKTNAGKLRVGKTDYWAFDAAAGDVMALKSMATGFAQQIVVRDPDLAEVRRTVAGPDQTSDEWKMVIQKPGRYLVAVSCMGDGGGGEYALSRQVYHAKEFSRSTPAKSEISDGQVQIWKFTATPNDPLLIRWSSSAWSYGISIYDDHGNPAGFQRQAIDANNTFGLLKVDKPQTFVIVLTGGKEKANYSIELGSIPGYKPASGAP
ncbi:MAG: hypothetical protein KF784_15825 [Fimbriimonadaceae bacterium]|nr:hypothetical protein [Fimbriimonadaceae bacterium]